MIYYKFKFNFFYINNYYYNIIYIYYYHNYIFFLYSYKFILKSDKNYEKYLKDPDAFIEWDNIQQVVSLFSF